MRPRIQRIIHDLTSDDEDIATYAAMNVLRLKELLENEILLLIPALRKATVSRSISVRFFTRKALNEVRIAARKYPRIFNEIEDFKVRGKSVTWQNLLKQVIRCDVDQKLVILDLLKDIDDPQIVPALLAYLRIERDEFVLAEIIKILGYIGAPEILTTLKDYLTHPDSRIRSNAAEALHEIGGKQVVESLVPLLSDDDNRVKATVARIISNHGETNVLLTLAEMLRSVEIWMRLSAAYALGFVPHQEAVDLLMEALTDVNREVQRRAVEGLGQLRASRALDVVTRVALSADPEFNQIANDALNRIKREPQDYAYFDPESDLAKNPGYLKKKAPTEKVAGPAETPAAETPAEVPARKRFNPFGIFNRRDQRRDQEERDELMRLRLEIYGEVGKKALKLYAEGTALAPYLGEYATEVKKLQYLIKQKESQKKEIKEESLRSTFVNFMRESVSRFSQEKRVGLRLSSLAIRLNETQAELGRRLLEDLKPGGMEILHLDAFPAKADKLSKEIALVEGRMTQRMGASAAPGGPALPGAPAGGPNPRDKAPPGGEPPEGK